MQTTTLSKLLFSLVSLVALLLPSSAQAQLQEVQQTVFGMDCAPCAYGLEKRIKRIEGVQSATVSLDKGLAHIQFQADNQVTLETLRTAVEESGFSAEEATVRITGTLTQEESQWVLTSANGERYLLRQGSEVVFENAGRRVTITGTVPKEKSPAQNAWRLQVTELSAQS
ncbi:MAG: cation transporter [Rhodothermales bacterium]